MAIHASVMVVGGDPATRRTVAEMLPAHGYYVIDAADGAEAFAWLEAVRPDAMLVDLDEHFTKVVAFLAACRQRTAPQMIPTIVLTGLSREKWVSLDATTVFMKPFDVDEVLAELRHMTIRSVAAS